MYIYTGMHILSYSHFQCDAKLTSCFPRPPPPPAEDAVCWNEPNRRNYYFRNIPFAIFLMRLSDISDTPSNISACGMELPSIEKPKYPFVR